MSESNETKLRAHPSDWIVWFGGACPVAHDVDVAVIYRKGNDSGESGSAGGFGWSHRDTPCDIIAYRPLSASSTVPENIQDQFHADTGYAWNDPAGDDVRKVWLTGRASASAPSTETSGDQAPSAGLVKRLQDAIEGECDGLVVTDNTARDILRYVSGLVPVQSCCGRRECGGECGSDGGTEWVADPATPSNPSQSTGDSVRVEGGYEHQRAIMESERVASADAWGRGWLYGSYPTQKEMRAYEAGFTNGWNRLAQQAAPAGGE